MKAANIYYPSTTRLAPHQVGPHNWICRVFDFFGVLIFTGRGRKREEASARARVFRTAYKIVARHERQRWGKQRGPRWSGRFLPRVKL